MRKIKKKKFIRRVGFLIFLCLLVFLSFYVAPKVFKGEKISYTSSLNNLTPEEVLATFTYDNTVYSKVLSPYFGEVITQTDNKYESHLIDLSKKVETTINKFVKEENIDAFNEVVNTKLLKKYPSSVVSHIDELSANYYFYDDYLEIYYYDEEKDYSILINYIDIKDYLYFEVNSDNVYDEDDGYILDPNKITIALTFDDGPAGDNTITLVNLLEDYKMSATFFMLGNRLSSYPTAVQTVANSHSEIGYHSYKHAYLTKQSVSEIQSEFQKSDETLYNICGKHFSLARPPYGSINDTVKNAINVTWIKWNLDTNDWNKTVWQKDAENYPENLINNSVNYVLENAKDGAIVLFHDIHDTSIESIKRLLPLLYEKGIQVTSVSNLAKLRNFDLEEHKVYLYIG